MFGIVSRLAALGLNLYGHPDWNDRTCDTSRRRSRCTRRRILFMKNMSQLPRCRGKFRVGVVAG